MTDDANHPHSLATLERMFWGDRGQVNELRSWHDRGLTASSLLFADPATPQEGPVHLKGATAATDLLTTRVDGDAEPRFVIDADGRISWGSGAAVPDVNLYRSVANTLKTDDSLIINDRFALVSGGGISSSYKGYVIAPSTTDIPWMIRGAPSQTANLQEWQDSAGNVLAWIESSGVYRSVLNAVFRNGLAGQVNIGDIGGGLPGILLGPGDTNLYRSGANELKTNDTFIFVGGLRWGAAGLEQTTVGAAGAASALPANPTRYLRVIGSDGTALVIPAYAAA